MKRDKAALEYLTDQSPLPSMVTPNNYAATIIYSKQVIPNTFVPDTKLIHKATIVGSRIWYDPYYRINSLIIALECPSLEARRKEIIDTHKIDPVYPEYIPHITVSYNLPPIWRRKYRWWINQFVDTFEMRHRGAVIELKNETIDSTDSNAFLAMSRQGNID